MGKTALAAVLAGLFGMTTIPATAELRLYVGGAIGSTSSDPEDVSEADLADLVVDLGGAIGGTIDIVSTSTDDSDTGFKVYGGVDFNEFFGVQVFFANLGQVSQSAAVDIDVGSGIDQIAGRLDAEGAYEAMALGAAGVVRLPLTEQFGAYAKLGFATYVVDLEVDVNFDGTIGGAPVSLSDDDDDDDDGTGVLYGIGAGYEFNDNLRVRVEWERYEIEAFEDDVDVDLFSAGIEVLF